MDNRTALIQAATELIEEKGNRLGEITVRDICARAGVGIGLLNYYFGAKDKLLELCVERIVNGVVERFQEMRDASGDLDPFEELQRLGDITLDYLFEHEAVSRISMLGDMRAPREDDNTHRTFAAYVPLVARCRPDWDEETVNRRTFCLIAIMQHTFLRCEELSRTLRMDLKDPDVRAKFHTRVLKDILEV